MTLPMPQIIRHLFRADTLEDVPRERLEELVSAYPSFSVGRYLLSRKLQTENAGHFSEETQKTNLYFTNPFWLQWLLQNEVKEQMPAYTRSGPHSYAPAEQTAVEAPAVETAVEAMAAEASAAEAPVAEGEKTWQTTDIDVIEQPAVTEQSVGSGEAPDDAGVSDSVEKRATSHEPVIVEEPGVADELANELTGKLSAPPPTAAEALLLHLEEARGLRQALVQMNEVEQLAPVFEPADFEKAAEAAAAEIAGKAEPVQAEEAPVATVNPVIGGEEAIHENGQETAIAAGVEAAVNIAAGLFHESGTGTPEPPAATGTFATALAEPSVTFEPYHTIDYFASLGIKLVQDENPSDKLGKQLKSFTEWLKVMRKLPQRNQEIIPDVATEHQIQAIAAHSITGKEVLTETMAEVLVKQGMREKAMEVYHKLSLLNPDKSAYFATRIEQLKID
jgi:hypothetical protein